MKKLVLLSISILCYFTLEAQTVADSSKVSINTPLEFSLMPKNMINYLGKVNKAEFEKVVGEPVGEEDNFIVYEIESKYEEIPIALRCGYRKSDGKLISVKFPTPTPLAYELSIIHLPEYKKFGKHKIYKNQLGITYRTDYKYKSFGMQVMGDVINFHTVIPVKK